MRKYIVICVSLYNEEPMQEKAVSNVLKKQLDQSGHWWRSEQQQKKSYRLSALQGGTRRWGQNYLSAPIEEAIRVIQTVWLVIHCLVIK